MCPGELPYLLSMVWQSGDQDPEQKPGRTSIYQRQKLLGIRTTPPAEILIPLIYSESRNLWATL